MQWNCASPGRTSCRSLFAFLGACCGGGVFPAASVPLVGAAIGALVEAMVQGNESRLTSQRPQYFQQVFGVPSGALAASLDGSLVCDLAHQIEGEVADDGHIRGAVAGAQA